MRILTLDSYIGSDSILIVIVSVQYRDNEMHLASPWKSDTANDLNK